MVSYSLGVTALMAITGLVATVDAAEQRNLREAHTQQERRALYSPDVKTDQATKCHKVIEGNPEVCILVCTEVTSHWATNKLIDETSKTSQRECEYGWQNDGHDEDPTYSPTTSWPTYSPSTWFPTYFPTSPWSGDAHEEAETKKPTRRPTRRPTPNPTKESEITPWLGDDHTPFPTHTKETTDAPTRRPTRRPTRNPTLHPTKETESSS